jgi:hypothetical protein
MRRFYAAFLAASLFLLGVNPLFAQAQLQDGTSVNGHLVVTGVPPTTTSCTLAAGSSDTAGSCATTSTSAAITFAKPYAIAPFCGVWDATSVSATSMPIWTVSTTAITLSTVISAHTLYWFCIGKSGN